MAHQGNKKVWGGDFIHTKMNGKILEWSWATGYVWHLHRLIGLQCSTAKL